MHCLSAAHAIIILISPIIYYTGCCFLMWWANFNLAGLFLLISLFIFLTLRFIYLNHGLNYSFLSIFSNLFLKNPTIYYILPAFNYTNLNSMLISSIKIVHSSYTSLKLIFSHENSIQIFISNLPPSLIRVILGII